MLSKDSLEFAKKVFKELKNEIEISFVRADNEKVNADFDVFLRELRGLSENIRIREKDLDSYIKPGIFLCENIKYFAVPAEREFRPFINAILAISKQKSPLDKNVIEKIKYIDNLLIKIFITPICPHCSKMVDFLNGLALSDKRINLEIIDASIFLDYSKKYNVKAAPHLVINDEVQLSGDLSKDEIANWILKGSSPEGLNASLLIDGKSDKVVAAINNDENIITHVARLISDPDMTVRLGTIVVFEDLYKISPEKVSKGIPVIIDEYLKSESIVIKGDAAYLLGIIGDQSVIKYLTPLTKHKNIHLRETAEEAIENIKNR